MHEHILQLAASMASPMKEELPLLEALCTAAEAELRGRLRSDLTAEDIGNIFCCAAAMLAVSSFWPCRGQAGVEQFTAGDVSIRTGGDSDPCQMAAELRRHVGVLMAPYCADDSFAFRGVRG